MSDPERYHSKRIGAPQYRTLATALVAAFKRHPTAPPLRAAIDLGSSCGELLWQLERLQPELESVGLDNSPHPAELWRPKRGTFVSHDLELDTHGHTDDKELRRLVQGQRFDLISCVEVAEHLTDQRPLMRSINNLAHFDTMVLFSCAVPGQRGRHHVSPRWQDYWIQIFDRDGWWLDMPLTVALHRALGAEPTPDCWKNMMIFLRCACVDEPRQGKRPSADSETVGRRRDFENGNRHVQF